MILRRAIPLAVLLLLPLPLPALAEPVAEQVARRAYSPTAPIRLDYVMPPVQAGQPLTLPLRFTTPVTEGALIVEVATVMGMQLLAGESSRVELGATPPPPVTLQLLPETGGPRYLVLQATIELAGGRFSRSFRIDLPAPDQ